VLALPAHRLYYPVSRYVTSVGQAAAFRKLCFLMLPRSYAASTARGYQSNHLSINPNPYRI
jgi:hypothetical protein